MIKQAIGAVLFVTATHSVALSLGGPQGNAVIGHPFDLMIKGTINADEALSGLCLEAELLYGDSRVPASDVSVSIHKLGADGSGILRVRSSQPVNEPVVTLVLKAGCSSRFSRSYALLADYLPPPASVTTPVRERAPPRVQEALAPVRATAASAAPQPLVTQVSASARSIRPAAAESAERESPLRLQPAQPRPAGVERVLAKHRPAIADPGPQSVAASAGPAPKRAAGPQLKLDLVVFDTPEPGQTKTARQESMLQAEAPVVVAGGGDQQRMQEMVRELEGLRSEQEKMRAAVEAVNAQLAQAGAGRHLDPLVLGLLGLCGAALSALAWLWAKLRRQQLSASRPVQPD